MRPLIDECCYVLDAEIHAPAIFLSHRPQALGLLILSVHADSNRIRTLAFQRLCEFRKREAGTELLDEDFFCSQPQTSALKRRLEVVSGMIYLRGNLLTRHAEVSTFASRCIVPGCDETLRVAVEKFSVLCAAETARCRRWHPQQALETTIFESWKSYLGNLRILALSEQLESLRAFDPVIGLRSYKLSLSIDRYLTQLFRPIQEQSEHLHNLLAIENTGGEHSSERSALEAEVEWTGQEETLRASVDTIRNVLFLSRGLLSAKSEHSWSARHKSERDSSADTARKAWFHPTLVDAWLSRRFGEPTHVEEDQDFPKFCAFTSRGVLCERLTEYEAYRRGETCDADIWQGLRVLKLDRCAQHPHNARALPTWGESSSAELAHFVHAESKFMTTHPKTGPFGEMVSEPHKRTCRFCSRRTELWAALREGKAFSRDLSSNFCRHHRSQQKDGQWERPDGQDLDSSTYESRATKVKTFLLEFARLHAHAAHRIEPIRTAQSAYPDLFVSNTIRTTGLVGGEHFELSRIAWQIVECNLDDRKKEIVMRLCCKESQASIARELGTSRQNIGRILNSIPSYFRFAKLAPGEAISLRDKIAAAKLLSDSSKKGRKHPISIA
ncbi:hypothetical protein [Terriglobus sp.]|uniref:hypothetical protein n=1 Tax=Terriglobus sp. TaxID=1889013 RepID=UPI003B00A63B